MLFLDAPFMDILLLACFVSSLQFIPLLRKGTAYGVYFPFYY